MTGTENITDIRYLEMLSTSLNQVDNEEFVDYSVPEPKLLQEEEKKRIKLEKELEIQQYEEKMAEMKEIYQNEMKIKTEEYKKREARKELKKEDTAIVKIEIPSKEGKIEATLKIKPARKTPKFFINYFPEKIYCSPYKYDILVKIPTSIYAHYNVIFNYLDAETGQNIKENLKGKTAIDIGKSKITSSHGITEIQYRVCFTVCSFHHYRRPFIFTASLQSQEKPEQEILFFQSKPFQTFARKNIKEDELAWISDEEEDEENSYSRKRSLEENEEEESKVKRKKKEKYVLDPTNYQPEGLNRIITAYSDYGMDQAFSGFDEIVNTE